MVCTDTPVCLSFSNRLKSGPIGTQVGVDDIISGVLPDGKESVIRELQKNEKVAMVGDGINDAPALTRTKALCLMFLLPFG